MVLSRYVLSRYVLSRYVLSRYNRVRCRTDPLLESVYLKRPALPDQMGSFCNS
jgi:hypothetical protein